MHWYYYLIAAVIFFIILFVYLAKKGGDALVEHCDSDPDEERRQMENGACHADLTNLNILSHPSLNNK